MFRDFPLETIHPNAFKAAEAVNCAREQGKFWEMHSQVFANQKALAPADLGQHARSVGLDVSKFQQCLDSGKYTEKIRKDMEEAAKAGVRGTPTFFLALTDQPDGKVQVVRVLSGAQPYANIKATIDGILSSLS